MNLFVISEIDFPPISDVTERNAPSPVLESRHSTSKKEPLAFEVDVSD